MGAARSVLSGVDQQFLLPGQAITRVEFRDVLRRQSLLVEIRAAGKPAHVIHTCRRAFVEFDDPIEQRFACGNLRQQPPRVVILRFEPAADLGVLHIFQVAVRIDDFGAEVFVGGGAGGSHGWSFRCGSVRVPSRGGGDDRERDSEQSQAGDE